MRRCNVIVWLTEINDAWNFVIKFLIRHGTLMGMFTHSQKKKKRVLTLSIEYARMLYYWIPGSSRSCSFWNNVQRETHEQVRLVGIESATL